MSERLELEDSAGAATAQRRGPILVAATLATFMVAVESTIVATAMPTIVADLGHFDLFSWVFAAYLLTQAVGVPIYGRLADLYGRKPVFFAGAALFLAGSTLCGFAGGMPSLILFRALQGTGAGAIQPVAYTIVGDIYAPAERARVQGVLSGAFGIAAVAGPSLGAFLVEHGRWPIVFWINLPIGAAAITMLAVYLREERRGGKREIDYIGAALLTLGVGTLMLALVQAASLDRRLLLGCVAVGAAALAALLRHERRVAEPMIPLALLSNRVVALGSLACFAFGAIVMGVSAFLPTYVQGVMGAGAGVAGADLAAMMVSWSLASFVVGRVIRRKSFRRSAVYGGAWLIFGSVVLIAMTPTSGPLWAGIGSFIVGVGMGFCNTTYLVSAQVAVSFRERGASTALTLFMRTLGQTVGAAVFGAALNIGLLYYAPQAGDVAGRLMDPALHQNLGAAEIAQLVGSLAASLRVVYAICALFGIVALAAGASLPVPLVSRPTEDDKAP